MQGLKRYIAAGLLMALSFPALAQQVEQLSLFAQNDYVINPAVSGSRSGFEGVVMNRNQWTGVTDAPRTFTLSLVAPFKNPHIGMGGHLFVDNVGPTRRTGMQVSYAWHMQVAEDFRLGLAASMGMLQFAIDGTRITLTEGGDPALYNAFNRQLMFDAKFGAYGYGERYYVGLTVPQLVRNRVTLFETQTGSRLEDHFLLTGGYRFEWGDFAIEPALLVKYIEPVPAKVDLMVKGTYLKQFSLGVGWRSNDALVAQAGYTWNEQLTVAFAYDFTTSALAPYAGNTTELLLAFRMP